MNVQGAGEKGKKRRIYKYTYNTYTSHSGRKGVQEYQETERGGGWEEKNPKNYIQNSNSFAGDELYETHSRSCAISRVQIKFIFPLTVSMGACMCATNGER